MNNIRMGNLSATDSEVKMVAKQSGCEEFILKLENGYDTIVGSSGSHLSGGKKQRISIARAMLKNSPIIIFNEATANVDAENEEKLQKAIEELTRNKTIIIIDHRLKIVKNADQILVIDNGKLVQIGNHNTLITEDSIYKRFIDVRKEAIW